MVHNTLTERYHLALARISTTLHRFRRLDDLLEFITQEVKTLLQAGGAMVILLDEQTQEFFFRVAALDDVESGKRMKEIRFPSDQGVAGHVYKTGTPLIVPDTSQSPYFLEKVDQEAAYQTRNMLDVPIEIQDRRIGVLCVVNKPGEGFQAEDVELLGMIAGTVAYPLDNARIHEELTRSYDDVQRLIRAKDRIIHHLSHELKTPLSVISASVNLLTKRLSESDDQGYVRILDRVQRNVQRVLDMQYEIEDLVKNRTYTTYHTLSTLLDVCEDELEVMVADEFGEWNMMQRVRRRIEEVFGPRESISRTIRLDRFAQGQLERLRPRFAHRTCVVELNLEAVPPITIPSDVLAKTFEGLLRNAVEHTPDGGRVMITVRNGDEGPECEIKDSGVGISEENQRLIADKYFPSYDTMGYASRQPYDFNAGGKGFDLLRIQIFAERYHFELKMYSERCGYLAREDSTCPGRIDRCASCRTEQDCVLTGGTTMTLCFNPADEHVTEDDMTS